MDAPVAQLVSGALAPADWWTNVRKDLYKHRQNATGFAILYQAAVSDASSAGVNFTVGAGGSSSLHLSVEASIRLGKKDASRVPVPVIRLDDAVDEDLWLLKMDTQGNEAKVLAGATRLFERRTVAHGCLLGCIHSPDTSISIDDGTRVTARRGVTSGEAEGVGTGLSA
jgi:FkbM family methyltransferase